MKSQQKIDNLFMDMALRVAEESYCQRKKVGAILVKDNSRIISMGYNGTPSGEDNCCEEEIPFTEDEYHNKSTGRFLQTKLVTKSTVIHAEDNVFRKLMRSPETAFNATLYCTMQPCEICAHLIIDAGVNRVVFLEEYRCDKGLEKLRLKNIIVEKYYNDTIFDVLQDKLDQ